MGGSIVVLGATGYTGGLVAESLTRRGLRPVVAGSREATIAPVAERLGGLDHRVADAADLDSVRALVGPGDVLVTTVGPFDRLGRVVARAAAESGAHYVDSTGEVGFVRHLVDRLDPVARSTGAVMLPALGYDYVPGLVAATLAAQRGGDAVRAVEVGYFVRGSLRNGRGMSRGTRRTLVGELGGRAPVRDGGTTTDRRLGSTVRRFDVDGRPRSAVLVTGTEVLFLPRHAPEVERIEVYNGWFPHLARPTQALSAIAALARTTGTGRSAVERVADRVGGSRPGPDARERARAASIAVAVARDASGAPLAHVEMAGPNPYELTGELMAWAADRLARGDGRTPGVVDPLAAFGPDTALAELATLGLREHH